MGRHQRRRVSLPDLVYKQPFEFCISISLLIMGVRSFVGHSSLSNIVAHQTAMVLMDIWILCIFAGAGSIVLSFLLSRKAEEMGFKHSSYNRTLERVGLVLVATAALAFSTAVLSAIGAGGLFTLGVMSGVILACILRMIALHREDAATLTRLRQVNGRVKYARDQH